ncbi:MAG: hypothetical protein KJ638_08435 [Chloroflexi bacterium]|nr:hypothetical protein [Chloroflexota bacterium]
MLSTLLVFIKLAVDTRRGVVAGGGELHADCESELLKLGSRQEDRWGADWYPSKQLVTFEALINIRPRQNPSMIIQDAEIREQVKEIVERIFR